MVDVVTRPVRIPVDDEMLARSRQLEVEAVGMRVMAAEDLLMTKLLALDEHHLDYESAMEAARALREQVDWGALRERTKGSPYAAAFFTLVEGVGLLEAEGETRGGRRT